MQFALRAAMSARIAGPVEGNVEEMCNSIEREVFDVLFQSANSELGQATANSSGGDSADASRSDSSSAASDDDNSTSDSDSAVSNSDSDL